MTALLDRDRWVFRQKTKIIELNAEFEILDEEGSPIGLVRQEGQSQLKKLARLATSLDQFMTHTLAVYDGSGAKVVELTRPRKVFKSTVLVKDASGVDVGRIVQKNMVGKIRFALQDGAGSDLGSLNGELASLELLDQRRRRRRGRADHQELGRSAQDRLHDGRSLPAGGQRRAGAGAAADRPRRSGRCGSGVEAGRARAQLNARRRARQSRVFV